MTDSALAAGRTDLYGADGTSFSAHVAALHHYRIRGHNLAPDGCGGG